MFALVVLTLIASFGALVVSRGVKSRAEAIIATTLVWNTILVAPVYLLGLANALYRAPLAAVVVLLSAFPLVWSVRRHGVKPTAAFVGARLLSFVKVPFEALLVLFRQRSLALVGTLAVCVLVPYLGLVAYLAPAWRDWDALWYHEPLTGFTIQNHGFSPIPLPGGLQVINGVHRWCESTQLWFAIWGGRRVVDIANVFFMPLLSATVFALVRRYTKDTATSIAWAAAIVLFPSNVRLLQSTMVDPESGALLLAAAFYVTHPDLDRRNAGFAVLALTLAVAAKIWSIVPVFFLALVLLVRLVRRRKQNGAAFTAAIALGGTVSLVAMQAFTYLRNWLNYQNPFWPMVDYDNPKLGIHWRGEVHVDPNAPGVGIDFNDPTLLEKLMAAPFQAQTTGHFWQLHEWGYPYVWLVLPLSVVGTGLAFALWFGGGLYRLVKRRNTGDTQHARGSALVLGFVALVSLGLSPALHIPRYHLASVAMLAAVIAWLSGTRGIWPGISRKSRLAMGVAIAVQLGSLLTLYWSPQKPHWFAIFPTRYVAHWLKTPYPRREVEDVITDTGAPMWISPVHFPTGMAREREIGKGDIVGFQQLAFVAVLFNNDYSNRVVWLGDADPFLEAERIGAKWVYAANGTPLADALRNSGRWEIVGPMETEKFGNAWRRKAP